MKVVLTGGGTGGHVYPAMAIYEELKKKYPDAKFFYVGTKHGIEFDIVPKEEITFIPIEVYGFRRKITFDNVIRAKKALQSTRKIKAFLKKEQVDVVIGTGGYVSGPVLLASTQLKIPTLLHEQNVYPGITNRFLGKRVGRILASFQESDKFFPKDKMKVVGNPVRKDAFSISKDEARDFFGVKKGEFFIFSFGGSGGQKSINKGVLEYLKESPLPVKWLHITGTNHYQSFEEEIKQISGENLKNFSFQSYCHENPKAIVAADLVIASAGAIGISEICLAKRASLLIPKAYTTNNHQEYNARMMKMEKAGEMLLESEVTGKKIREIIETCFLPSKKRAYYEENAGKLAKGEASADIVREIQKLLEEQKK